MVKFDVGLGPNNHKVCKSRRWSDCTYARASPVSLSRKLLSPVPEVASRTGLSLSRSIVHCQTWRLTGLSASTRILAIVAAVKSSIFRASKMRDVITPTFLSSSFKVCEPTSTDEVLRVDLGIGIDIINYCCCSVDTDKNQEIRLNRGAGVDFKTHFLGHGSAFCK